MSLFKRTFFSFLGRARNMSMLISFDSSFLSLRSSSNLGPEIRLLFNTKPSLFFNSSAKFSLLNCGKDESESRRDFPYNAHILSVFTWPHFLHFKQRTFFTSIPKGLSWMVSLFLAHCSLGAFFDHSNFSSFFSSPLFSCWSNFIKIKWIHESN